MELLRDLPADRGNLIASLMDELACSFRLDHTVAGRTLGSRVEERLVALGRRGKPRWGEAGAPEEVASEESDFLRFLYHPHLFPGMEPRLRLAHELQFDLLPTRLPEGFPLAVSAVLESYCHLSGDLLGWRSDRKGRGMLWILDVSGHGVRSGLASAVLKILLDHAPSEVGPAQMALWLHEAFRACRNPNEGLALYSTGIFLEVQPSGEARYASAGHQPGLLRHPGGRLETLDATGPPMALLDSLEIDELPLELDPRQVLVLYTDGLVETESSTGEQFAASRLEHIVRGEHAGLQALTQKLHRAVLAHNGKRQLDDDLTVLAVRTLASP